MKTVFRTEQESFWAGEFGDQYQERNPEDFEFGKRAALFSRIIGRTRQVGSILELGANIGNNLRVLERLLPGAELAAVEINARAVERLRRWGGAEVYHQSILEFGPHRQWDLAFTSGVLIHLAPEALPTAYQVMHRAARRYLAVIEYYNPTPVEVPYRGHSGRLFKRDFAGELLDRFPDLHLVDYGFVYHRDPNFPLDDLTWFLLEKQS